MAIKLWTAPPTSQLRLLLLEMPLIYHFALFDGLTNTLGLGHATIYFDFHKYAHSNDALRARGIIPPKADSRRSPSPDHPSHSEIVQHKLESSNLSDDDDLLDLEDEDIPSSILEKYRAERMEQVNKLNRTRRYGSVLPIGRESYTREINEASEEDIDEDNEELKGKGTGVVCFLWKDGWAQFLLLSCFNRS